MTDEMNIPICWERGNVGKAISIKAKIDEKQTHYFLACHSPMTHIQDEKSKRKITEEELYRNLTTSSQRDKQIVIYGEPGTGKSHLVHWLKLRFDYGHEQAELENVVPVIIERRSGSLKDALAQLIEQLGEGFQKYLDPVQQAIEKLSDATARQMLANELSLELGPRWTDRDREKIDKRIKHLGQACRAEGFGGWLCRDGGVIERTIGLLIESSDIKDRENTPQFQPEDLLVKDRFRTRRKNSEEVLALIDELDEFPSLRELAADHLNEALRHAIVDMVGLSGANLRKVFDAIREDLNSDGKELALFIEDVSAMSELDVEIVNALEPQDRTDLCPLTAVLGMTHTGYAKLRDNQKQRIEFVYRVDGETTENWSQNKETLAKFTARYLNAIRLEETEVVQIATERQASNGDVTRSKCTSCSAKTACHSAFGAVEIEGTEIGLYPFSRETAPRVLNLIRNDEATPYSANQRGLLIRLLSPVLSDTASLDDRNFPNAATLPVHVSAPIYWTEFQQNYLGDYAEPDLNRIQVLAGLWIQDVDESDVAATLMDRYLAPLSLPGFTKSVKQLGTLPPTSTASAGKPEQSAETQEADKNKKEVKKYLDALSGWSQGQKLKNESYFRDLLSGLIKNSVRWENHLQPAQFDSWTWKVASGRGFISIEGQSAAPDRLYFEFPKNEETRALLEALFRFDKEGHKTWNFHLGETHKRRVAAWVRKNELAVVEKLNANVDRNIAIKSAVQMLCLLSTIRDRQKVPQKSIPDLMNVLFNPKWGEFPNGISKEWNLVLANLDERHEQVANFLKNEISVRQGRGGVNFVSPEAVYEIVTDFLNSLEVVELDEEFLSGFWKSRFEGLPNITSKPRFEDLSSAIEAERAEIESFANTIGALLTNLGFDGADIKSDVMTMCDQVVELNETTKKAKVSLPDDEYEKLVKAKTFTEQKMTLANAISKAQKVATSQDPFDILTFNPSGLIQCKDVIQTTAKRIEKLDAYVGEQEDEIREGGDPEAMAQKMFDSLNQIADLSEEILEVQDVQAS